MITKTLASLTLAAALSTVPVTAKTDLRVGTYNLRRARLDEASAENNWARRESRLIASLMACDSIYAACRRSIQKSRKASRVRFPQPEKNTDRSFSALTKMTEWGPRPMA